MKPATSENFHLLEEWNKRIVFRCFDQPVSNITGQNLALQRVEFSKTRMSRQEFDQVLLIIDQESLVVLPQLYDGNIEGYIIIDPLHLNVLLQFGRDNIPEKQPFEKLCAKLCRSEENLMMIDLLTEEQKIIVTFPEFASA